MNTIVRQRDPNGRTRFFVLPIDSESGFKELMRLVSEELRLVLDELKEGPGTLVQAAKYENVNMVFVLSDLTGMQFYPEDDGDRETAERLGSRIEAILSKIKK
jgi:hypothetical protein